MRNVWKSELKLLNCILWTYFTPYLKLCYNLCYFRHTENDIHWSLSCFRWKILQQIETLCQCTNAVSSRCMNILIIFYSSFFHVVFPNTITCCFCIIYICNNLCFYVNSMRFKLINSSCRFLELNYKGLNRNFLRLKRLLIDGYIESNLGPPENDFKSWVGCPKKLKCLKEQ